MLVNRERLYAHPVEPRRHKWPRRSYL